MAGVKNKFTIFLYEQRNTTLSLWAKSKNLSPTSVRNTIYGIRPIKKVVKVIKHDNELFNLLPLISQNLIKE